MALGQNNPCVVTLTHVTEDPQARVTIGDSQAHPKPMIIGDQGAGRTTFQRVPVASKPIEINAVSRREVAAHAVNVGPGISHAVPLAVVVQPAHETQEQQIARLRAELARAEAAPSSPAAHVEPAPAAPAHTSHAPGWKVGEARKVEGAALPTTVTFGAPVDVKKLLEGDGSPPPAPGETIHYPGEVPTSVTFGSPEKPTK